MRKMLFIVNPNAGQRRVKRYLSDIISIFNRAGYQVETYITAGLGDAIETIRNRVHGKDLVVCAGGDGTFNETINGLLRCGANVPIGYIPCGSTNDFASSMRLSTNVLRAARQIVTGTPVSFDAGRFGERYFSYVASFGAFTKASYATPQYIKNALGHTAYVLSGIQELSQIRTEHIRLEAEDRTIEDDFIFGAISNSTSVGGILTLNPNQVDMSDGKFEIMLVRVPRSLSEISECIQAVQTQKYNCSTITFFSAREVTIHADPSMFWTLDGEKEQGHSRVTATNLHNAITIIK